MDKIMKMLSIFTLLVIALNIYCAKTPVRKPMKVSKAVDKEKPESELTKEEQAEARFHKLAGLLEDWDKDKPIQRDWLLGELNEVVKINPKHAAARYNLAILEEEKDPNKNMTKIYNDILDDDNSFIPATENLAAFSLQKGDTNEALSLYERALNEDSKATASRLGMARIQMKKNNCKQAIDLARKVLQRRPGEKESFHILTECYVRLKNMSMAELIIGRALKIDKDDPILHYFTAQILLSRDKLSDGVAKLKHVITLKPEWLKVRAQLADIALNYNDFGNAAQQFEAILKHAPKHRASQIGLAIAYKGLGRFDQAEKIYQTLLENKSDDVDTLWNLAVLYHRHLRNYDEAISLYKKAKSLDSSQDKDIKKIPEIITQIEKEKKDSAARKAREEKEQKRQAAIAQACEAVARGQKPKTDDIGGEQERIKTAWDLLLVNAVTHLQNGDVQGGKNAALCALKIVPNTPGAGMVACAQLRVNWMQIQDQVGLLSTLDQFKESLATMEDAIICDPENPDVQLITQQLKDMIKQSEAGGGIPSTP